MRVEPSEIVRVFIKNNEKVRETARELGISPSTVIFWRRRARTERFYDVTRKYRKQVTRQSTAPHTLRVRTGTMLPAQAQDDIVALRRQYGYGAGKIRHILQLEASERTVHRFLKRKGLTAPTRNYRRPRMQGTSHMYLKNTSAPGKLQMDIKYVTPELSGLPHTTYLYAIIDIYTRWKQGVILESVDQELAIRSLRYNLQQLPVALRQQVDFIQNDNGLEFQERFHRFVTEELGLAHHYIHKSSPNENAVIERSFRTDEEEFFWRTRRPLDLEELNEWYALYLHHYNTSRPHLGLEYLTPREKLLGDADASPSGRSNAGT